MRNQRKVKRRNHAKGGRVKIMLPVFDAKAPTAVRIVDQALAVQGWTRTARLKILRALKSGDGDAPFVHCDQQEGDLTDFGIAPSPKDTHAKRCAESGLKSRLAWTTGMSGAADPIDN